MSLNPLLALKMAELLIVNVLSTVFAVVVLERVVTPDIVMVPPLRATVPFPVPEYPLLRVSDVAVMVPAVWFSVPELLVPLPTTIAANLLAFAVVRVQA